jgi:5-methylcytosine-specific restriction endonuclease McrA
MRSLVAEHLESDMTISEVAAELGVAKSTVCYHARRLGIIADPRFARRYDWSEVQSFYDEGHSIRQCARAFGFCTETWHRAVRAGLLRSRPAAAPIETYLVEGRKVNRHHLKARLLKAGLKEHRCELCGIDGWRGKPLSMSLHHVNGDGNDNRFENLQLLCPNCHSQTPNFGSRNSRHARARERTRVEARLARLGIVAFDPAAVHRLPKIGVVT